VGEIKIQKASGLRTESTQSYLAGSGLTGARVLWLVIALLAGGLFVIGLPVHYGVTLTRSEMSPATLEQIGLTQTGLAVYNIILDIVTGLIFFVVGLLLFVRRSNERMALISSLTLLTWGITSPTDTLFDLAFVHPQFQLPVSLLTALASVMLLAFGYTLPDGRFAPRWTRPVLIIYTVWTLAYTLIPDFPLINPRTWPEALRFIVTFTVYISAMVVAFWRIRHHYTPSQVQQVKWIIYGFAAAIVGFVAVFLPEILYPALKEPGVPKVIYFIALQFFLVPTVCAIPLTIAFSVQRYRLWEIDLLVNRSIVYGILTVLLAVAFVFVLAACQALFEAVTGGQQSPIALTAAAVVVGVSFQPLRRRIQRAVDHRFFGLRVDLGQVADGQKPHLTSAPSVSLKTVGGYDVFELIGAGSQGEIYKGQHPILHRPVAIKMLPKHLAGDDEFRIRFEREARTVAALRHPNIVNVFDFGHDETAYYMVMEYIDGRELKQVITGSGQMSFDEVRSIIKDLTGALDYAHEQGIVHRDIKPSNVMIQRVTGSGAAMLPQRAILMDFGIARIIGGSDGLTRTGMIGTLDYVAPEQIMQARQVDARADIYALGAMTYEMVTGQLPFPSENPGQVLFAHLNQPAPDPSTLRPDLPPDLTYAIMRALAKDPEDRFQTAGEFAAALS
jgi:tRNA A-37 threonylcarbamoyl transferase component Bud32